MKAKQSIQIMSLVFAFCFLGTLSQAQITITVLETSDYPGGTGTTSTVPYGINDRGDVVGAFTDENFATFGFVRFANGAFSPLIVEPNDTGNFTEARGINHSRTICGDYIGSDGAVHGYFRVGGTFTEYDVPGALVTSVFGINDAGDFVGDFIAGGHIGGRPFLSVGGSVTVIGIPFNDDGAAFEINNANAVVGDYSASFSHGFYQDSTGELQLSIDPTGSNETILLGINDHNWIVGTYFDDVREHGLLFIPPETFVTFDYGARTSLQGINRRGQICGSYFHNGLRRTRGFIAVATRATGDKLELP